MAKLRVNAPCPCGSFKISPSTNSKISKFLNCHKGMVHLHLALPFSKPHHVSQYLKGISSHLQL